MADDYDFDDFEDDVGSVASAAQPHRAGLSSPPSALAHDANDSLDDGDIDALIQFARMGDVEAVTTALDAGLEPDSKDPSNGETALIVAAREGHQEVVKLLVAAGARPGLKARSGYSAADVAHASGHNIIVQFLVKKGAAKPAAAGGREAKARSKHQLNKQGHVGNAKGGRATSLGFNVSHTKSTKSKKSLPPRSSSVDPDKMSALDMQRSAMHDAVAAAVEATGGEPRGHSKHQPSQKATSRHATKSNLENLYTSSRPKPKSKSVWARENVMKSSKSPTNVSSSVSPVNGAGHSTKRQKQGNASSAGLPIVRPGSRNGPMTNAQSTSLATQDSGRKYAGVGLGAQPQSTGQHTRAPNGAVGLLDLSGTQSAQQSYEEAGSPPSTREQIRQRISTRMESLSQLKAFGSNDSDSASLKKAKPLSVKKQALRAKSKAKRKTIQPNSVQREASTAGHEPWVEDDTDLITLENFDFSIAKDDKEVFNSPRSIAACKKVGVLPSELLSKTLADFESQGVKFPQMHLDHYEQRRQELFSMAREERRRKIRHLRGKLANMHNHSTADVSINETQRSLMSAASPLATATLIKKEKERMERLEAIERKRIEQQMAHILEQRDVKADMSERLKEKELERKKMQKERVTKMIQNRVGQQLESMLRLKQHEEAQAAQARQAEERRERKQREAEERMVEMEERRLLKEEELHKKMVEHQERIEETRQRKKLDEENQKKMLKRKQEQHEQNFQHRIEERKVKLEAMAEQMRLKEEAKQFMVVRKQRMEEFKREQLKEKVERDRLRAKMLQKQKEELLQQRQYQKKKLKSDRKKLEQALDDFVKTGDWQQPKGIGNVEGSMLGDGKEPHLLEEAEIDKNPEARMLYSGEVVKGAVLKDKYAFYKVKVHGEKTVVRFKLSAMDGDPDLYLGNAVCPKPVKGACTWSKAGFGDDKITVYYFDRRFAPGYMYVGVHGATDSEFTIKATWKEGGIAPEESLLDVGDGFKSPDKDAPSTVDVAKDLLKDVDPEFQEEVIGKFRSWKA